MNRLTATALRRHDSFNDVERRLNIIIAVVCGTILGVMLALGV